MTYQHNNKDPNLNNLHHAMEYDAQGNPVVRVEVKGLSFDGNIDMTQVEINNDVGNPIPISATTATNTTANPLYAAISANTTANSAGNPIYTEVSNDSGNPLPISATTATNTATNPIYTLVNTESPYSASWHTQVARGKVTGVTGLSIIGYNSAVPVSATYIPIWELETVYTYPVSAIQMLLWSSSASDTNVTVTISGLDSNYDIIGEDLTLTNGTVGVLTVNSYLRINSMQTKITSTVNPVGGIRLGNSAKTQTYSYMNVGTGKSQAAIYTVPRGYTFYLTRVNVYCGTVQQGNNPGNVTYRVQTISPTGIINNVVQTPFSSAYETTRVTPRPYTEKTDIQWQVITQISTSVGFQNEGLLISNTAP